MSFKKKVVKTRKVGGKRQLAQKNVFGESVRQLGTTEKPSGIKKSKIKSEGAISLTSFAFPKKKLLDSPVPKEKFRLKQKDSIQPKKQSELFDVLEIERPVDLQPISENKLSKFIDEEPELRPDIVENLIEEIKQEEEKQITSKFDSSPLKNTIKILLYTNRKEDKYSFINLKSDLRELGFSKDDTEIFIEMGSFAVIPLVENKMGIAERDNNAPLDITIQFLQPIELNNLRNQLPEELRANLRVKELHQRYSELTYDEWVELNDNWRGGTFHKHLLQYPGKKAILNLKLPQEGFSENWYQLSIEFQKDEDAKQFKDYIKEQYPDLYDGELHPVHNGAGWSRKYKNNQTSKFSSDVEFLKKIFNNFESDRRRLIPTTDERIKFRFERMNRNTNSDPLYQIKGKRKRDITLARLFDGSLKYHHSYNMNEQHWTYDGKRYSSTKEMIDNTNLVHPRSNEVNKQIENFLQFER